MGDFAWVSAKLNSIDPKPKNMNRQAAKVAKGMRFLSLQRRTRTRVHGELGVSVPLPNWPVLALALMAPWRLNFRIKASGTTNPEPSA